MRLTIPQRLLLEDDKLRRELERAAKSGDSEARLSALQQSLAGRFGDDPIEDLYGPTVVRGKPISKTPMDVDPEWDERVIKIRMETREVSHMAGIEFPNQDNGKKASAWEAVNFLANNPDAEIDLYANSGGDDFHGPQPYLATLIFKSGKYEYHYLGASMSLDAEDRADGIRDSLEEVTGWYVSPLKDWWINFFRTF